MLIVDGDESSRETLGVFSEMLEFDPILAEDPSLCGVYNSNGAECDNEQPCADFILVDLSLKTMTGLDFVEHQVEKCCKAPVKYKAVMARSLSAAEFKQANKIGCHVLQKPVTYEILENWINKCRGKF